MINTTEVLSLVTSSLPGTFTKRSSNCTVDLGKWTARDSVKAFEESLWAEREADESEAEERGCDRALSLSLCSHV